MIDLLLSWPTVVGFLVFAAATAIIGLTVYIATFRLHTRRQTEDALKEIRDATGNLFRVVGWLFTLLLSLTFSDALSELAVTESAVESEAAAIEDVYHNLRRFGLDETREIRSLLIDYTRAVIEDDWPALADDRLSTRASALLRQLEDSIANLDATGPVQERLMSPLLADVDLISNHRLSRRQQAREKTSRILLVIFFGYLITMVYFGIYQPRRVIIGLLSLYTIFVGIVLYLVIAADDPFHGALSVEPEPMRYTLELMQDEEQ